MRNWKRNLRRYVISGGSLEKKVGKGKGVKKVLARGDGAIQHSGRTDNIQIE